MKKFLTQGYRKFEILRQHEVTTHTRLKYFEDKIPALHFLQGFTGDYFNRLNMRAALNETNFSHDLSRLSDFQAVDLLAGYLAAGALVIAEIPDAPVVTSDQLASRAIERESPFDVNVQPVPRPKPVVAPVAPSPPASIRMLLWNLPELGGGFYRPEQLPDYATQSYAALVAGLKVDICLLQGLRRQGPPRVEKKNMDDGSPYFVVAKPTQSAGVREADRILVELKKIDAAANWHPAFLKASDGSHAYQADSTIAMFFRTKDGLALHPPKLLRGPGCPPLGVPKRMLHALFDLGGGVAKSLSIVTPLGSLEADVEAPVRGDSPKAPEVLDNGGLPESCIIAVSAPFDLGARRSELSGALGCAPPDVSGLKSVAEEPQWARPLKSMEGLLHHPLAVAWADPALQDQAMYWLFENLPAHPRSPSEVKGVLSDLLLLRSPSGLLQIEEFKNVDMIRAAFKKEDLTGTPCPEDGLLESLCRQHGAAMGATIDTEFRDQEASQVAVSAHFARFLSDHWPVVAKVKVK